MKKFLKLWEGCRMMNVCGVNIIGCPDTGVIIGLNSEGEELVGKGAQFSLKRAQGCAGRTDCRHGKGTGSYIWLRPG